MASVEVTFTKMTGRSYRMSVVRDNVIITRHAAYYSEESIGTVRRFAAEEVVRVLTGQAPLSPVNAGDLVEARWSRSPGT